MNRRGFLASMLALSAAPAIVRASSLMPVSARVSDWAMLMSAIRRGELHTVPVREYAIDRSLEIAGVSNMRVSLPVGASLLMAPAIDAFVVRAPVLNLVVENMHFGYTASGQPVVRGVAPRTFGNRAFLVTGGGAA